MSTLSQQQPKAELTPAPRNKAKETAVGFVIGGLAACGAVTFTNPWEVNLKKIAKIFYRSKEISELGSKNSSSITR